MLRDVSLFFDVLGSHIGWEKCLNIPYALLMYRGKNMGTRCELHIRDKHTDKDGNTFYDTVELWKHWDGYPDGIKDLLEDFAQFVNKNCANQPHRMLYPEDFASMLIAHSYEDAKKMAEKHGHDKREIYPDIRPRGNISDAEYIYILSMESPTGTYADTQIVVKVFDRGDDEEFRKLIREGKEPTPDSEFTVPLTLPPQSGIMAF